MKSTKNQMKTFSERVVEAMFTVPSGRVTTYGRLARAAGGGSMASRSITAILAKAHNEGVKNIPFHRIVYADGKIWISLKYHTKRIKLYKKEGIKIDKNNRIANFPEALFEFK
jgi:methylated-DNA-protein-cysteine methyltransferase-like protein